MSPIASPNGTIIAAASTVPPTYSPEPVDLLVPLIGLVGVWVS